MKLSEESEHGHISVAELVRASGFDEATTHRAIRALQREPFFGEGWGGDDELVVLGPPTGAAMRIAGQWPSPDGLLERLIAAFAAAGDQAERNDEERAWMSQAAARLQADPSISGVAIEAFGGTTGKIIS